MQQYFAEKVNGKFRLKEKDQYHLETVMRVRDGDEILIIFEGEQYLCSYKKNGKDYEITEIAKLDHNPELGKRITVYQALIRNENFDMVIQKATELGASRIVPTIFERNVVKIPKERENFKLERFQAIAKGASEQSHRTVISEVLPQISIKDIELEDGEIGIVAYEKCEETKTLSSLEEKIINADKISIIIGPEGGITPKELQLLLDKGFISVSLGKRILRSETATLSLLSMLDYIIEIK